MQSGLRAVRIAVALASMFQPPGGSTLRKNEARCPVWSTVTARAAVSIVALDVIVQRRRRGAAIPSAARRARSTVAEDWSTPNSPAPWSAAAST